MDRTQVHAQPQVIIALRGWQWFLLGVVLTLMLVGGISACYQGRKISRLTGLPVQINLPEDLTSYDKIVSISFHKDANGETFKDVTYIGSDGKLRSHEYNDWGIFQGEIIWNLREIGEVMQPNGPGTPYTLLFGDEQPATASLPESFRAIYGGDWVIPDFGNRPYVYSNFAQARDGRVSFNEPGIMSGGDVTGANPHDRWLMGLLRARADAVMTGDTTLKVESDHMWTAKFIYPNDAPAFTALRQAENRPPLPLLCIVSQQCDFPWDAFCFQQPDLHIVLATTRLGVAIAHEHECTARVDILELGEEWVDLPRLTQILYHEYGIRNLLCEGGPRLMGGMLAAGLIDEEFVTWCPLLIGENKDHFRPSYIEGITFLPNTAPYSRPISLRRAGDFLFLQTRCRYA